MWIRVQIAAMVYLMVQAVMFGIGVTLVLAALHEILGHLVNKQR